METNIYSISGEKISETHKDALSFLQFLWAILLHSEPKLMKLDKAKDQHNLHNFVISGLFLNLILRDNQSTISI